MALVERFHRSLKESLKTAMNYTSWLQNIPLTLLGLRTAVKSDSQSSTAELVYGTPLHLPGELIIKPNERLLDPASFVDMLRLKMFEITSSSPRQSTHVT